MSLISLNPPTVHSSNMFWEVKVRISEQSYKISLPVIYVMRLLGVFPIAIKRDKIGLLCIQWSPWYAAYSWILGIVLHSFSIKGIFKDLLADHSHSVRVRTRTDVFVNIGALNVTQLVAFSGIFVIPTRFSAFFTYVECINEADGILRTKHSKWDILRNFATCYGTLLVVFLALSGDYLALVATAKNLGPFSIFRTYAAYYLTGIILTITEYEFQYMAFSLRKRIRRLNSILEIFNVIGSKSLVHNWKKHQAVDYGVKNPKKRIGELMRAYIKLAEAAECQNHLLGLTGAIVILAGFWHLVTAAYFLLSELGGKRRDSVFIAMKSAWCFFFTGRLFMFIEPWNGCTTETETTKKLVCKLMYSGFGDRIRKELRTFQLILGLKTINFSLAGLAHIDRSLLTSVLGRTTTYLVIFLQYQAEDRE